MCYIYLFEDKMKHRLNLDIKNPNYTLLKEIFKGIPKDVIVHQI